MADKRDTSDKPLRWGIIGTGEIARVFAGDLRLLPDHEVLAVGSRNPATAETFAAAYGVPRAYGSYAELAADADLDVVYVATPHSAHFAAASLCLDAGRAVLVEKPFTVSADEAAALVALARARGVFALEAMWTRFNPLVRRVRQLVADGAVGDVQMIYADFSRAAPYDPASRLWAPELAGGALLDLGVYPLSFVWMLLGRPGTALATAAPAPNGVDANTGILLRYEAGAVALLHCGLTAESPRTATIIGTGGRIEVAAPFYRPAAITLRRADGAQTETWTTELPGRGYTFQAEEVARCLRAGLTESPYLPLDETVAIMRTLDALRAQLTGAPAAGAAVPVPAPGGVPAAGTGLVDAGPAPAQDVAPDVAPEVVPDIDPGVVPDVDPDIDPGLAPGGGAL